MSRPAPYRIATDTWVVPYLFQEPGAPVAVYINSLVIAGKEPVLVDCGPAVNRAAWLEDVFSIVDLADVRWVFLSHDEVDHVGNLDLVLEECPKAQIVTSWFASDRMSASMEVPPLRSRWINDGESFSIADRTFTAVRPPIFDSPTTRGLFDHKTGVYWAADAFSAPVLEATTDAADLDAGFWRDGFLQFQRYISPWHTIVDASKFEATVRRVQDLQPSVVATGHGPAVTGARLDEAFRMLAEVPHLDAAPFPGQAELDQIVKHILGA